ncbi:hypothetical protein RRG08_059434 [Elysia crispata]|uniref:G-protein coupled receptors family 1 profile domain-containing protein n=1 Tax=Elysia crispata TaxID=231223 RepID=A0AAE1A472_9GAST|nr:hypothetical protein RRG08_059434 [Elysia crispata]
MSIFYYSSTWTSVERILLSVWKSCLKRFVNDCPDLSLSRPLDRYWSVRQPLKYLHKRTKRRALSMIGVVWVVSSLWIIPIASWHYFAHGGVRTVPHDECDTEYAKNSLFKVITAFFNFYLPLSVMFILYFRIFIAIRKRSKFEMGHRYPGGTVISFKSSNNVTTLHSLEDSDFINEDVEGRQNHNSFYHSHQHQAEDHHSRTGSRQNGTRNPVPNGCRHLRLMAASCSIRGRGAGGNGGRGRGRAASSGEVRGTSRGGGGAKRRDFTPSTASRFKVEYIYDENVLDPQTEKIERYFYEDSYPLSRMNRARWTPTNTNNENRPACGKSPTISLPASSSSTLPSTQRSVRFRSSLHPVHEGKSSNRLSAPPTPYHSAYSQAPSSLEYHQQNHKSQSLQHQKQESPPEHFMTVGGKTTAVVKRTLFKRQKHLDDDESKVCLRGGGKAVGGKDNEKPRSRLKLDTFCKNKPVEIAAHGSSSLSSSSASTFGDSMEGKWALDSSAGRAAGTDGDCGACGNGRGENGTGRNGRAGCGCCVQIDEQIRFDTPSSTVDTNCGPSTASPSYSSPSGLRVHRGKEVMSGCEEINRIATLSNRKEETTGCCCCRRSKNIDNDDEDDDDDDDDDAELSSFSLNTRCDSKTRRSTGGAASERGGVASGGSLSAGGVSGLKERLKTMRQSSSLNKEIKAARQLGVIMGAFTLCFLPYFILFMVVAFCDDCVSPGHLTTATWVGSAVCCPVVATADTAQDDSALGGGTTSLRGRLCTTLNITEDKLPGRPCTTLNITEDKLRGRPCTTLSITEDNLRGRPCTTLSIIEDKLRGRPCTTLSITENKLRGRPCTTLNITEDKLPGRPCTTLNITEDKLPGRPCTTLNITEDKLPGRPCTTLNITEDKLRGRPCTTLNITEDKLRERPCTTLNITEDKLRGRPCTTLNTTEDKLRGRPCTTLNITEDKLRERPCTTLNITEDKLRGRPCTTLNTTEDKLRERPYTTLNITEDKLRGRPCTTLNITEDKLPGRPCTTLNTTEDKLLPLRTSCYH